LSRSYFFLKKKIQSLTITNNNKGAGQVQDLTIESKTSTSLTVKWNPGTANTKYRIYLSSDGGGQFFVALNGLGNDYPQTSMTINFLTQNKLYYVKVQGGNNAGYEDEGSIISDTTFITRSFFFSKKR